jgi:hypothetical protein
VKNGVLRLSAGLIVGWLLCLPGLAAAEIYKYRDSVGRIHLTDQPMRGAYELLQVIRIGPSSVRRSSPGGGLAEMQRRRRAIEPVVAAVARDTQLRPELLHAVIRAESAYQSDAVSRKGAVGLMQLMPATAERFGVRDRRDPQQNIRGGATYLRQLLDMFDNDLRLALAAYNAGENAVLKYGRQIPPYPETQQYVERVLTFLGQNRQASAGDRIAAN